MKGNSCNLIITSSTLFVLADQSLFKKGYSSLILVEVKALRDLELRRGLTPSLSATVPAVRRRPSIYRSPILAIRPVPSISMAFNKAALGAALKAPLRSAYTSECFTLRVFAIGYFAIKTLCYQFPRPHSLLQLCNLPLSVFKDAYLCIMNSTPLFLT